MTSALPRYGFVDGKACEFLLELAVSSLPLKPAELIKRKHWGLVSYSGLLKLIPEKATVGDISAACQSRDGFTVKSANGYCIAYNDTIKSKSRVLFTLMHEAGHIMCGHFELPRPRFKSEYRAMEVEANFFASNVLAPAAVVIACGFDTPELLKAACGLSYYAAKVRLGELAAFPPTKQDEKIKKAFASYITAVDRRRPTCVDVEYDG